ncbi:MAG: hypothetical protein D6785_01085, partial [Planctomycetota bacterium]
PIHTKLSILEPLVLKLELKKEASFIQFVGSPGRFLWMQNQHLSIISEAGKLWILDPIRGKPFFSGQVGSLGDQFGCTKKGSALIVGNPEGHLYQFREDQLKKIWQGEDPILGDILVDEKGVIFASPNGNLYGYQFFSSQLVHYNLQGIPLLHMPSNKENQFYVAITTGKLFCFDPELFLNNPKEAIIWKWNLQQEGSPQYGLFLIPQDGDNLLILVYPNGQILGLSDKQKQILWRQNLKSPILREPVLVGNHLLVLGKENILYNIHGREGSLLWKKEFSKSLLGRPGWGKYIYVGIQDTGKGDYIQSALLALDKKTGQIVWKNRILGHIISPIVVSQGKIYFSSTEGYVYCIKE